MLARRNFIIALLGALSWMRDSLAQEGVFLSEEEAPKAVFPEGTSFERKVVKASEELRERMKAILGGTRPSIWEDAYTTFLVKREEELLGYAVIIEEIGKHRSITFIVGIRPDGKVQDVAVMVYREPYGGEVRYRRFLKQYKGRNLQASLLPSRDIRNIVGATLSVEAIGRGVKKALALVQVIYLEGEER